MKSLNEHQAYRGLEGHPSELARIAQVKAKLQGGGHDGTGEGQGDYGDDYREEIGYKPEELREANRSEPFGPMPTNSPAGNAGGDKGAGGSTIMIEAGVTSSNSPNPTPPKGRGV